MLKFVMALIAATLFVTPCLAQTAEGGELGQSAASAEIDPVRLAAARRVVAANGSANSMRFFVDRMLPIFMGPVAREYGLNQAQQQVAMRLVGEEMLASTDELIDLIARVYATHMTAEDLTALAEFYESPAGSRYVAAMPTLMNDSARVSEVYAQQVLVPRIQQRVRELEESGRLNP